MAKHIVTCQLCGGRFDASKGYYYNSHTRRYTCPACKRQQKANARSAKIGMRQSVFAMIVKIFVGAIFFAAGVSSDADDNNRTLIVGVVLGGALIAWGIIPFIIAVVKKIRAWRARNPKPARETEIKLPAVKIQRVQTREEVPEKSFYEQEREKELQYSNHVSAPAPSVAPVRNLSARIWDGKTYDELLPQAADVIFEANIASASVLQRRLKLGYSRAARIIEQMEDMGVIGPFEGSRPRQILMTRDEWLETQTVPSPSKPAYDYEAFEKQILRDEANWRREMLGLSPVESELDKIDHMEGHAFEYWCADLLKQNGFENVEVTPGSNDQGVDVLAEKGGIKYAVQCKCYSSDLGNGPVQEVNTGKAFYRCHIGVVMTNRHFTSGAKAAADATGTLLWDREKLIEMMHL